MRIIEIGLELLQNIVLFLDVEDIANMLMVSKTWAKLSKNDNLWKQLVTRLDFFTNDQLNFKRVALLMRTTFCYLKRKIRNIYQEEMLCSITKEFETKIENVKLKTTYFEEEKGQFEFVLIGRTGYYLKVNGNVKKEQFGGDEGWIKNQAELKLILGTLLIGNDSRILIKNSNIKSLNNLGQDYKMILEYITIVIL